MPAERQSIELNGVRYEYTLSAATSRVVLHIEEADTMEAWKGDFTAAYVEEVDFTL